MGLARNLGGSKACLGGRGNCCESCVGGVSGVKRTPADSTEGVDTHTNTHAHTHIKDKVTIRCCINTKCCCINRKHERER